MRSRKYLATAFFVLVAGMAGAQSVQAEPLTPLTPDEIQYLEKGRYVLTLTHDPTAFRSDGELLVDGRYACDKRTTGIVGYTGTYVPPALTQLAFLYLCPK